MKNKKTNNVCILMMVFIFLTIGIGNAMGASLVATPEWVVPTDDITVEFYDAPEGSDGWIAIYDINEYKQEVIL